MQSMKKCNKAIKKPAWPRRRAEKLSAVTAALRPSKLDEFLAARPAHRSGLTLIVGHIFFSTIYYESIWLDPFTNIAFAISTSENRPTFNLSYWMTCTRFRMNSRNRSVSQNSQRSSASGSSIILDKYRPSIFQRDMPFQGVRQRGNAWIIK